MNAPDEIITKNSRRSVDETVARLSDLVAANGLKLFAVVDHSGEARANGLELRDTKRQPPLLRATVSARSWPRSWRGSRSSPIGW